MQPVLSIVVSSYNRAGTLAGALENLLALAPDSPAHEVVVVDNNSTDRTREVVGEWAARSGGRLRYVFEPTQGVCYARNRGVAEARAALIAFTDDDVRAAPDWATAVVRTFAERPDADFVGGRVLPIWPAPPPAWFDFERHSSPLALIDYGPDVLPVTAERYRTLVTANVAFRRSAFDRFGYFDPRHQHMPGAVSAAEDHEFEARVVRAGGRGYYDPRIVIRAEVQADRLSRAYHRRWWYDHGRAMARVTPPGTVFDGGCQFTPEPPGARHWLGAPAFMYRAALGHGRDLLRGLARRDHASAFMAELKLREQMGQIRYIAEHRRGRTGDAEPSGRRAVDDVRIGADA